MSISKKVILTGSFGVGKTSLFNQFIYNKFGEKYLTTIGVKVSKKTIKIDDHELVILLWDIAGEVSQDKVPVSYFLGAAGIVYVFDLSRPSTFTNIQTDLAYLKNLLPESLIKVVGNKKDLLTEEQLQDTLNSLAIKCDITTSAKTGENVEKMFEELGSDMLGLTNNS